MIDYRLLQALSAVVEQAGFERAAKQLFLTQSAVSHRIKQLEAIVGQPVLLRTAPPVATPMGQRLLNHLQQVRQMEASLGLEATSVTTVRLAVNADSLATWLPAALVMPDYPELCFDFVVEDQSVGLKRMKQGDVMACLCASSQAVNGARVQALGALRYRAVASPAFIQRYQLDKDLLTQLPKAPCLVFNQDDQLQHQFLLDICGQPPQKTHLCPSSEGFLRATLAGLGFGLLPELQMQTLLESKQLVDITPDYQLDTPLYWHYWQNESPLMAQLRQQITATARQQLNTERL
ncbi:LysR family transcriptional regulator ArgP [Alkalimonas sp. NCh-2]|uniref:LysR family transcriptional regulator ArgP n=1 Tax=Alkalimonas sp. NCh-2 TaxID=3144846 RepID=UPI0031F6FEE8